jgi:hypothetical protein
MTDLFFYVWMMVTNFIIAIVSVITLIRLLLK